MGWVNEEDLVSRLPTRVWDCNRGVSRHHWWRGPRERSPPGRGGLPFSLFVDDIPRSLSNAELRKIFQREGQVSDVYISKKVRLKKKECFGFVRYKYEQEAVKGIRKLNGLVLSGSNLAISMAKYLKGGVPMTVKTARNKNGGGGRSTPKPALTQ
ncbi:unnamed protein product [Amaranthus hypochondriacus]